MKISLTLTCLLLVVSAVPLVPSWVSSRLTLNNVASSDARLIKLGPDNYQISSEAEKLYLKRSNINFIDVTEQISIKDAISQGLIESVPKNSGLQYLLNMGSKQLTTLKKKVPEYNYPTEPSHEKVVTDLISQIDIDLVYNNLANFTSFYTRYYKSESGYESANWLFALISSYTNANPDIKLTQFKHAWDQYSIIVSIPGKSEDKVIIGAHQDSTNLLFPNLMKAPGADDDGSGTVTILEVLRLIVENKLTFHNTLEFHFYSAEEGGLLGSIAVFDKYFKKNETVVGMLQQDMTGYTKGTFDKGIEEHFGLINDYTSKVQNDFLKVLIKEYASIPYRETECGYACSDFASATENGYPSSFIIESEFKYTNKYIHSVMDTIDRLDFNHIKEHIKLTIGYAIELSSAKDLHKTK